MLLVAAPAIGFLALWQFAVTLGWLSRVPGPFTVFVAAAVAAFEGDVLRAFGGTLGRTVGSFVLAAALGVSLGVVAGAAGAFGKGVEGLVDFLRSIPAPALLPVFLSLFGLYTAPKIAFAVFVCFLINVIYTAYGVRREQASLRTTWARIQSPKAGFVLWNVVLPGAAVDVLAGLRITLSLALVLSTLVEYVLTTGEGAGVLIRFAYDDNQRVTMYALIVLLGVAGYSLNLAFLALERAITRRVRPGVR